MNSIKSSLIKKLDNSPAMSKYQNKHAFLKSKGPHIGLYVKANNEHKWVFWISKFERYLLNDLDVKMLHK
jgi:hypothetical protein